MKCKFDMASFYEFFLEFGQRGECLEAHLALVEYLTNPAHMNYDKALNKIRSSKETMAVLMRKYHSATYNSFNEDIGEPINSLFKHLDSTLMETQICLAESDDHVYSFLKLEGKLLVIDIDQGMILDVSQKSEGRTFFKSTLVQEGYMQDEDGEISVSIYSPVNLTAKVSLDIDSLHKNSSLLQDQTAVNIERFFSNERTRQQLKD